VRYDSLRRGRLVRRYKRFLADVELDGALVTVHCPNPGSMQGCMREGGAVWLSDSGDPARKLRFTWELSEVDGAMICVHTGRANGVVAEALAAGRIAELAGWPTVRREVRYGDRSRVDFLLERGEERLYLEVKSVTLGREDGLAAFPDSVTARGTRHLAELEAMVAAGHRAALLFVVARSDGARVAPADDIDPVYGAALRRAAAAGVELLAYRCAIGPDALALTERVPVVLPPTAATIRTSPRPRSNASRRRERIG
jgi:sugar fermentation stimulation protein A